MNPGSETDFWVFFAAVMFFAGSGECGSLVAKTAIGSSCVAEQIIRTRMSHFMYA